MFSELKAFRELRGLTQGQCAEQLGISQGHLSKIEAGLHQPGVKLQARIRALSEPGTAVASIEEIRAAADRSPEFRALLAAALKLMRLDANG